MNERSVRKKLMKSLPLETKRLLVREPELSDTDDMYAYASLPEVCRYLLWEPHINRLQTEGYIESLQKRCRRGLYCDWAVAKKSDGRMIGTCGFAYIDSENEWCEIGYVLAPWEQGKGYMTEALSAVTALAFETLGLCEARLRIIAENTPSRRLAERVGYGLERVCENEMEIKGVLRSIAHYRLTREQYLAAHSAAGTGR